jgi:hypothetical protein
MLQAFLDWQRATLLYKCAGLTGEQLAERAVPPSDLSLLGLIRHLTRVERAWFRQRFADEPIEDAYDRDGAFKATDPARAAADYARFTEECRLADAAAANAPLEATFNHNGETMSLRLIYLHMIDEITSQLRQDARRRVQPPCISEIRTPPRPRPAARVVLDQVTARELAFSRRETYVTRQPRQPQGGRRKSRRPPDGRKRPDPVRGGPATRAAGGSSPAPFMSPVSLPGARNRAIRTILMAASRKPVRRALRRYASVSAVAKIYGVDTHTVRRWVSSGLVHGYRIGDRLLKLDLDEVEAKVVRVVPAAPEREAAPERTTFPARTGE